MRVYGLSNDLSAELRWSKKKGGKGVGNSLQT